MRDISLRGGRKMGPASRACAAFLASLLAFPLPSRAGTAAAPRSLAVRGVWAPFAAGLGRLAGIPQSEAALSLGPVTEILDKRGLAPDRLFPGSPDALPSLPDEALAAGREAFREALAQVSATEVEAALQDELARRTAALDPAENGEELPSLLALARGAGALYGSRLAKDVEARLAPAAEELARGRAETARERIEAFKRTILLALSREDAGAAQTAAGGPRRSGLKPAPAQAAARKDNPVEVLRGILSGKEIDGPGEDSHNLGWKAAKDRALADPGNPFVGWAPKRIRVRDVQGKSRAELDAMLGRPIPDGKWAAVQAALAAGRGGEDIAHHLYKPYDEMLLDQEDGGTGQEGQNSVPHLGLLLYLLDFLASEIRTPSQILGVLRGLLDPKTKEDRDRIEFLSRKAHGEFQAGRLVEGERGYEREIVKMVRGSGKRKVPARTDFDAFGRLHPSVRALDEYTLLPAARWLLGKLESRLSEEKGPHPLYHLLRLGPSALRSLPLVSVSRRMAEARAKGRAFEDAFLDVVSRIRRLDEALAKRLAALEGRESDPARRKEAAKLLRARADAAKAGLLWRLAREPRFGVARLGARELAMVFYTLKNHGLFADMARLYEEAEDEDFKRSRVIVELYAVALHKSGRVDRSEEVIRGLMDSGEASSESAAILGKIHKLRYEALRASDRLEALAALERSVRVLEEGFFTDFYYYPGINLVYNLFTQGVELSDPAKLEKAFRIAELVHVAARKAGGENSSDYWVLGTLLESSVILGLDAEIDSSLPRVLDAARWDWEIGATVGNLRVMRAQIQGLAGRVPDAAARLERFDRAIEALEARRRELLAKTAAPAPASARDRKTAALFGSGFYYGEIGTNFVGGNVDRGGQLHAHSVNAWDVSVARALLKRLGLEAPGASFEADLDRFNQAVDAFIRERFRTSELRHHHTPEHDAFDLFMKSMLGVMGVERDGDSITNIMVDLWLGRGDCRQHAHVKQLLFDVWKSQRANAALSEARKALAAGDETGYRRAVAAADEIARTFMLVFDSKIVGPLGAREKYHPYMRAPFPGSPELQFVRGREGENVEDHTWNGLLQLDAGGRLARFRMVDSFYWEPYRLGGPGENGYGLDVPVESIAEDGSFSAPVKVRVYNPMTAEMESVDVNLKPTAYSAGGRKTRMKPAYGYGEVLFRGMPLSGLSKEGKDLDVEPFFDESVRKALEAFQERVSRESPAALGEALEAVLPYLESVGEEPPSPRDWAPRVRGFLKSRGISMSEENEGAVHEMLETVAEEAGREGPFYVHRVVLGDGIDVQSGAGRAAFLAAVAARSIVSQDSPALGPWVDDSIRGILLREHPGEAVTPESVDEVRSLLRVERKERGARGYRVRLKKERPVLAR